MRELRELHLPYTIQKRSMERQVLKKNYFFSMLIKIVKFEGHVLMFASEFRNIIYRQLRMTCF
jgi:hypothetical protein